MINTGKCPKCESVLRNVKIEEIDILLGFSPRWKGISYVCPTCQTILGVSIDPISIKSDLIDSIEELLKRR